MDPQQHLYPHPAQPTAMQQDERVTITVCGDGGCGKSSITLRLVRSQWTSEYDPTIEDSYSVTRTVDGRSFQLHLTDTAGQEEYRGLFSTSNLHADAFLLVYDITQPQTLPDLTYFTDLIAMESDMRADKGLPAPVKMVVGNKCDLGKLPGMRKIDARTGLTWARDHGAGFMETSAKDLVNVEETFQQIIRRVVDARRESAAAALGGQAGQSAGHAVARTQPLTPLHEKDDALAAQGSGLKRFFRKLGCFG